MQKAKKIINIITTIFICLIVLLAILLVGVRLFGLSPYTVLSGSMEPNYHVGSIVYVQKVNPFDIREGDVITYVMEGDTVVTHRVIEIIPDSVYDNLVYFKTQGDANGSADDKAVHPDNVMGKVVGTIPLIGYVAFYVQTPPGSYIALAFCACILIMTFLPDLLDKIIPDDKNEKKDQDGQASEK